MCENLSSAANVILFCGSSM